MLTDGGCEEGFSLLELMVTLLIAGIIWLVALPAYQQTMFQAGRTSARGVLMDVLARQEQYLANNNRYATGFPALGLPERYFIDRQADITAPAYAAYEIQLQLLATVYVGVKAEPLAVQSGDVECGSLQVTAIGARSASGPGLRCW
tara:strand:- start:28970 stop:29407 length:438 start_codon:yes stop_codon:yes gene_type:complete